MNRNNQGCYDNFAGLIATTFFEAPHFRLMDRMFADVYPEEINFMIDFGLIDSIGQVTAFDISFYSLHSSLISSVESRRVHNSDGRSHRSGFSCFNKNNPSKVPGVGSKKVGLSYC